MGDVGCALWASALFVDVDVLTSHNHRYGAILTVSNLNQTEVKTKICQRGCFRSERYAMPSRFVCMDVGVCAGFSFRKFYTDIQLTEFHKICNKVAANKLLKNNSG